MEELSLTATFIHLPLARADASLLGVLSCAQALTAHAASASVMARAARVILL